MITDELILAIDSLERDVNFLSETNNVIRVYVSDNLFKHVNLIFPEVSVKYAIDPSLKQYQYRVVETYE
jgi:hypothetical protein